MEAPNTTDSTRGSPASPTLPSVLITLNEPLVACGVGALYVALPRPVRWPWLWSLGVLALVVVFFDTQLVLDQAESLVPLMIAPIALDVSDQSLLDRAQPDRRALRLVWCALLAGRAGGLWFWPTWSGLTSPDLCTCISGSGLRSCLGRPVAPAGR